MFDVLTRDIAEVVVTKDVVESNVAPTRAEVTEQDE